MRSKTEDRLTQVLAKGKWKKLQRPESLPLLGKISVSRSLQMVAGAKENLKKKVHDPPPQMQILIDHIEEVVACNGNKDLIKRGEEELLKMLNEWLDAAIHLRDGEGLRVTVERVKEKLPIIKLADKSDIMKKLVDSADELHAVIIKGQGFSQKFFDAVLEGDLQTCQNMITEEVANPSAPHPEPPHRTPLIVATRDNDIEMVEFLLMNGAETKAASIDGFTALHWAAERHQDDLILLLLSFQANPCLKDKRGQDPLMKLLRRRDNNSSPAISWDIRKDIRLPGRDLGSRSMTVAEAQEKCIARPDCFGFHFRPKEGEGASPEGALEISLRPEPPEGWDGVADTSRRRSIELQKRRSVGSCTGLADIGINLPAVTEGNLEERRGSKDARKSLEAEDATASSVSRGSVSKKRKNPDEGFYTYIKVVGESNTELMAMMEFKADPTQADKEGQTALHHHLRNAKADICLRAVELLLEASADVNHLDRTKCATTPFLLAIKARRMDVVNLMLAKASPPPDVDARGLDGVTACRTAVRPGSPTQVVKDLRQRGGTDWADATLFLGGKTKIDWDTRRIIGEVPLEIPVQTENVEEEGEGEEKGEGAIPKEKITKSAANTAKKPMGGEQRSSTRNLGNLDPEKEAEKEAPKSEFEKWIIERFDGDFVQAFKSLDTNKSGSLTKNEFVVALTTANYFDEGILGRRTQDRHIMFSMLDENGGGDITVKEFMKCFKEGIYAKMKKEGLG